MARAVFIEILRASSNIRVRLGGSIVCVALIQAAFLVFVNRPVYLVFEFDFFHSHTLRTNTGSFLQRSGEALES